MKYSISWGLMILVLGAPLEGQARGFEWANRSDRSDATLPGVKVPLVKGDVITAGSSTVYPLSEAIVNQLKKEGFQGNISIDSIGTGAGFERFTQVGETDVANASQKMKPVEIRQAKSIGRDPIELRIATDALTVAVSATNTFATDITSTELALLFSRAERWSDVRPTWPSNLIQRFIPGTDSGTFSFFVEKVFKRDKGPILASLNTQKSENDNILVRGVASSPYAVGFFGYSYYEENHSTLRALSIDGVAPNEETVRLETYPLTRPLFLYTTAKILQDKPQVAAFVVYYLREVNRTVRRVGYFPAPASDLERSKTLVLTALKGRI